jgi:hypothetical protein
LHFQAREGSLGVKPRVCDGAATMGWQKQDRRFTAAEEGAQKRAGKRRSPGATRLAALLLSLVTGACTAPAEDPGATGIGFDLDRLNAQGLVGPPDGLRALHYEYCIPDRPETLAKVRAIDPSLEISRGAPGRVGCGAGELLCLGHTHQPGHRKVLERLDNLPFTGAIRESFFE